MLDQLIHLPLALFQIPFQLQSVFSFSMSPSFLLISILSSQHLPCLLLRRESEGVWGTYDLPGVPHAHSTAVPVLHAHHLPGPHDNEFSNAPSSLTPPAADSPTSSPLLFTEYQFTEFKWNLFYRTYSVKLLFISLCCHPGLLLALTATCVTPYCRALHTQAKWFIDTSAFPSQLNELPGPKGHDLGIFVFRVLSLGHE